MRSGFSVENAYSWHTGIHPHTLDDATNNLFGMANGRVGFSRWEHLENVNDVKLFSMNPDCTQVLALGGQHDKPGNSLVQVTMSGILVAFVGVALGHG